MNRIQKFFRVLLPLLSILMFFVSSQQVYAAVAYDAVSESHTGTTGSASEASFSWTHTPVGTPKGVLVYTFTNATNDDATSVTYGGVSMTAVTSGRAVDTAAETGDAKAWFLGSSVPTGAQTVVVNRTNNTDTVYAVAITVTAGANTEVAGVTLQQENQIPAEASVTDGSTGIDSVRFAGANYGGSAIPIAGANSTALIGIDYGVRTVGVVRETTAGQGARSVGFSDGTDDWACVLLDVREVVTPPTVSTNFASNVGATTAILNGTKTGGDNGTESGFAYSTNATLASGVSTTTLGAITSNTTFSSSISSLTANTTYYFRAYVTNGGGTGYGIIRSFVTGNTTVTRKMRLFEGFKINLVSGRLILYQQ